MIVPKFEPTIAPGELPGGMIFCHFLDDSPECVLRQELEGGRGGSHATAHLQATIAAERTDAWIEDGHVVFLVIYDGTTGKIAAAAVADRNGKRVLAVDVGP